jgi:hypothetical protein
MTSLEVLELVDLRIPEAAIRAVIDSMPNLLPGSATRIIRFKRHAGVNLAKFGEKVPAIAGLRRFAM